MRWLGSIVDLALAIEGIVRNSRRAQYEAMRDELARERGARVAAERRANDERRTREILTHYADIDRRGDEP